MEGGVRSGERSGNLVKKKSSSGCLIIKKKGVGVGVGSSGSKKVFESKKKRKRSELVLSDSDSGLGSSSSDELLQPSRRKVVSRSDKHYNGSVVYKTGTVEDSEFGRNGEIDSERKRSRLDVFEFDEYDAMDRQNMRKSYMGFEAGSSRHVMVQKRKQSYFEKTNRGHSLSVKNRFEMEDDEAHIPLSHLREKFREPSDEPIRLQGKNGVLKVMMNKKNKVNVNLPRKIDGRQEAEDIKVSSSKDSIKKNRPFQASLDSGSKQSKNQVSYVRREKNEPNLGKSMSTKRDIHMGGVESETEDSDTSLKVGSTSAQARSSAKSVKNEDKGASSAEKITPIRDDEGKSKPGSDKKPVLYVRRGKSGQKLGKSMQTKSDMAGKESETEDSDASMKQGLQARSSRKGVKNKVEKASSAEKVTPIRGREGKVQRGSGTEKQLLREKIKNMLVNAGWTIDYRPRRNRDYLDAVYINPSGTAYWSIIKAYDALQKDINVNTTRESPSFTPLPDEILNKLTRQTQKKIQKEMKKKRRNNGGNKDVKRAVVSESEESTDGDRHEEKLSSFMKQNGRKSRKIGRCTLLVRGSDKGLNSESDGFVPYLGKRSLLSWLIDSGSVQLSEKVQYMNRRRTRVLLEGWITRDGIHCGCCSKILSVSKFEIHAGSKLRQPFQNMYLESGVSLLQCQIDAWNKQEEGERCGFHTVNVDGDDPNDDTCGLCGDGGDLICCDGCPSTFHQNCLEIQMLPPGDWHCPNCTCKFCGIAGASVTQENGATADALLTCSLCEKKYHELCSQEMDALPANSNGTSTSFCGRKCRELFDHIQKLLGVKHELEAGFSWSLIHRTDPMSETSHRGFPQRVESNSKLAVALSIMDECFLPIVDRRSGINLIHNVLYNCGSNFSRLNYSGFYTAILERGDEIISAASIRMHGTQLAEMPFIATRQIYRRQGMCRRLFCAIESALCSIKVEKMVIPAIAELMHTWTEVFGFNPLDEPHKKEMRSTNMLVFPGTDMLLKLLLEQEITEGNIIANSGAKSIQIKDNHGLMTDSEKKSGLDSSAGCDFNTCDDANVEKGKVVDQNLAAPKSKVSVEQTPSFGSESVEKLVEAAADLNCSSSDTSHHDILERENTPTKENTPEDVNGHQNPISISSIHDTDEITVQVNSDLNGGGVVDMESDFRVVSEVDSNPEVARVEGKIRSGEGLEGDAHEVNEIVADTETFLDSCHEVSAQNTIEEVNGYENHVSGSTLCATDECVLQLNSNLNESSEVEMEADVDSDAKVDPINAEVGVKPVYDSLGESFAENGTEEDHDNENPILGSTLFGVENILQSSAVEDLKDGDALNSEVTRVKPILDSVGEISVQNGVDYCQESLNSSSVSTVCGSDESKLSLKSNSNHQNALDVESELDQATGVVSEEVAIIGSNNQSKAEDDVSDTNVVKS